MWKPIESAPKDWTDVLLYVPDADEDQGSKGVFKGWFSMEDGGFNCWMSYEANSGQIYPTHWMPLPEPPKPVTKVLDVEAQEASNFETHFKERDETK